MQTRKVLTALLCAAYTGCAANPDKVDARYTSPNQFQGWSCEQLVDERKRLASEVQRVTGLQKENAEADVALMAVGLIVFWPALFGLAATKDRKDELARLKGEYEAVDESAKNKQCALPPPPEPAAPADDKQASQS